MSWALRCSVEVRESTTSLTPSNVIFVARHGNDIPQVIRVVGVSLGTHRTPIVYLKQILQFVKGEYCIWIKRVLPAWLEMFSSFVIHISECIDQKVEYPVWPL